MTERPPFDHAQAGIVALPDPVPAHPARLKGAAPLLDRLWRIALYDVEANIVRHGNQEYFGAGNEFGSIVYTRDISYAGILGLNRLYPAIMQASLAHTRRVRLQLGFTVPRAYYVPELLAQWALENTTEDAFLRAHHTNNFMRRTDDVIWLWAAHDLAVSQGEQSGWRWLYDTGKTCFEQLYTPLFDPADGLYRGQASFIDIHFEDRKATGYPQEWDIADCVRIKAVSTNALYYLGLSTMADAARRLGATDEAAQWSTRAADLKAAIRQELLEPDGTFTYYKAADGTLSEQREALGTALAVLAGIVTGEEAQRAVAGYPVTSSGVPIFWPFFPDDSCYHNNAAWPFVDTFFLWALEKATGQDQKPHLLALLARTCNAQGTFFELADFRDGRVKGSSRQLWTAASFINVCMRTGLV